MRKRILNIMATTGITLVVLSVIARCYGANYLYIEGVFQSLFVNVLIHIVLLAGTKLEFKYPIAESVLKVGVTIVIVLLSGWLFGWYDYMALWVLGLMVIIIYSISVAISAFSMLEEVRSINVLLEEKNKA